METGYNMFYREDLLLFRYVPCSMKPGSDIWLLKPVQKKLWTSGSWCADVTHLPNPTEFKTITFGDLTLSTHGSHQRMLLMLSLSLVRNYSWSLFWFYPHNNYTKCYAKWQWYYHVHYFECNTLQIKYIIITVGHTKSVLTILSIVVALDNLINFIIVLWTLVKISRRTKDKLALELHTVLKFYYHSYLIPSPNWMPIFLFLVSHVSYGISCISYTVYMENQRKTTIEFGVVCRLSLIHHLFLLIFIKLAKKLICISFNFLCQSNSAWLLLVLTLSICFTTFQILFSLMINILHSL